MSQPPRNLTLHKYKTQVVRVDTWIDRMSESMGKGVGVCNVMCMSMDMSKSVSQEVISIITRRCLCHLEGHFHLLLH